MFVRLFKRHTQLSQQSRNWDAAVLSVLFEWPFTTLTSSCGIACKSPIERIILRPAPWSISLVEGVDAVFASCAIGIGDIWATPRSVS